MACCLMAPSHYLNQCWHISEWWIIDAHCYNLFNQLTTRKDWRHNRVLVSIITADALMLSTQLLAIWEIKMIPCHIDYLQIDYLIKCSDNQEHIFDMFTHSKWHWRWRGIQSIILRLLHWYSFWSPSYGKTKYIVYPCLLWSCAMRVMKQNNISSHKPW